jgi:hypothetical protein
MVEKLQRTQRDMTADELLFLNEDEIDFKILSDEVLRDLALGPELFVATSALGELTNRNGPLGLGTADEILSEGIGDRYLQASALEAVFDLDWKRALAYWRQHIDDCDPYLLNSTIRLMTDASYQDFFQSGPGAEIVGRVRARLRQHSPVERYPQAELIEKFHQLYG